MLNWLYKKAGNFKKYAFSAAGISVATSTATSTVSSTISWITNLTSVIAVSAFSVFKNMETAETIISSEQRLHDIADTLRLQKYQGENSRLSFTEILTVILPAGTNITNIEQQIHHAENDLNKTTPDCKFFANVNIGAQITLSFLLATFNIVANLEDSEKDSSRTWKNILNMSVVPLCILSQYLIHSLYVSRNLRPIANQVNDLHKFLEQAQKSLQFRALQLAMVRKYMNVTDQEIHKYTTQIDDIKTKLKLNIQHIDGTRIKLAEYADPALETEKASLDEESKKLNENLKQSNDVLELLNKRKLELIADENKFKKVDAEIEEINNLVNFQF